MTGADAPRVVASPGSSSTGADTPRPRVTGEGQAGQTTGPAPALTESEIDGPTTGGAVVVPPTTGDAVVPPTTGDTGVDAWALVQRAQGGDTDAFAQIYDRYVDVVYRYVYYRIGDRPQAEDFTSETFVRALRRLDSFSYRGRDLGAWLVTIARNIIFDHVKSSRYRLEVVTGEIDDASQVQEGPENAVLEHLESRRLLRCVKQLGSEQQECIVLRFLQGQSVAETADIMGKNDGAIKALQHRAVRRLAALLKDDHL